MRSGHFSRKRDLNPKSSPPQVLLSRKVDLEEKTRRGATALHLSAGLGHGDVALALLEARASLETKDAQGSTALLVAASRGQVVSLKRLLEHKVIHTNRL